MLISVVFVLFLTCAVFGRICFYISHLEESGFHNSASYENKVGMLTQLGLLENREKK